MERKKIINIEFMRVVAILSVILIHMSMNNFYDAGLIQSNIIAWVFNNIYYTLTRFCVPAFFIISAYISFNGKSNSGWVDRVTRLGIPYIFWSAVYYYYQGGDDLFELFKKLTTSVTSFHLWFIPPFLGFTLFLPAIKKVFSGDDGGSYLYISILVVFFAIVLPSVVAFMNYFYGGYDFLYGMNGYGLSLPALLAYGFAFPFLYKKCNVIIWSIIYLVIVSITLLINVFATLKLGKPDEFFYGYTTPLVFISSFILFNIIMSVDFSKMPKAIELVICKIAECSFGVYLVHWLVFMVLDKYGLIIHGRAIAGPIINVMIVFFISFSIIYTIRLVKPLRKIV